MEIEIEHCRDQTPDERPVEIVERKGIGHPDTICDLVSERFSVALSNYYLENHGLIFHHNVDKALLSAGRSTAAFRGGKIDKPIDLYLSGRATDEVEGRKVPLRELAESAVAQWFASNMHALDAGEGLRLHCITQPGSPELVGLFMRQKKQSVFLANDTSCGVGFAPLSELERIVLAVERSLNSRDFKERYPETGEDIKVMGFRARAHLADRVVRVHRPLPGRYRRLSRGPGRFGLARLRRRARVDGARPRCPCECRRRPGSRQHLPDGIGNLGRSRG
jgi:S-adenosylmethionine synthetase